MYIGWQGRNHFVVHFLSPGRLLTIDNKFLKIVKVKLLCIDANTLPLAVLLRKEYSFSVHCYATTSYSRGRIW